MQDILFRSGLDPRRKVPSIHANERQNLYNAIQGVIGQAIVLGGRDDESDLFGQPGRYIRMMDSRTAGKPCPACGNSVQKIAYLGGACYICPRCQT